MDSRYLGGAEAVHGINTARALAEGVALGALLDDFARVIDTSRVLVAHKYEFRRENHGSRTAAKRRAE